jgi:D-xylose transport system permease protein
MGLLGGIAAVCRFGTICPLRTTILVVVLAGIVLGIWQGIWIAYLRVPAFIVTLGGYLPSVAYCWVLERA